MRTFTQQSKPVLPAPAAKPAAGPAPVHTEALSPSAGPGFPSAFDFSRIPARSTDVPLYRQATGPSADVAPPLVHDVLRGQGKPLPDDVLRDAEARMGQDFADVRVHTDARAGASAEAVAAQAYTVGRQIVFAPL